jgi:hypothetical protein
MANDLFYRSGSWNLKRCSVCHEEKQLDLFYKQKDGGLGVTSRCKVCVLASNKRWQEANPEHAQQVISDWQKRNRVKCNSATQRWRKSNLPKDAARASLYRARKNQQLPAWANLKKIEQIYVNCPAGFHVDHIIPLKGLKASGLHVESNLQYLLAKDNLRKRNLFGWETA